MKLFIAGDFCPQKRVADLFERGGYSTVLGEIRSVIADADYSIVNFECPVCDGTEKPIEKYGPNLHCTERGVEALKWAGFDCVTIANNHFLDYGEEGVEKTLDAFSKYGIDYVGGGVNLADASKILYKDIKGKTLAIINCCEHEFSIATETTAGSNPLNPIQQYYAIKEAKAKADNVLIIVHGGHEQYNLPSPRMKELYRFFIDTGADAVVNHHQHCYSGYEIYNNKPIFYGIGNFCFDKEGKLPVGWTEGYLVKLGFHDNIVDFDILPYKQFDEDTCVKLLPVNSFTNQIENLNSIIADNELLKKAAENYYHESMKQVSYLIEPVQNRYIAALQHRRLFPSLWSKTWLVKLQNYILCESHRDKVEYFFKNFR